MKVLRIVRLAPAIAKIVFIDYGNVSEKVSLIVELGGEFKADSEPCLLNSHVVKRSYVGEKASL